MQYVLTLCIPTNGVIEWVKPVLESIYKRTEEIVKRDEFQVVVTDNGNNETFRKFMEHNEQLYTNLLYKRTDAQGFLNQIECFKLAEGKMVKFINHRMPLLEGSVDYFVEYAKTHDSNTVVYFTNGNLKEHRNFIRCEDFNDFVKNLSYWSSWSGGLAFWHEDMKEVTNLTDLNVTFPHTNVLFMKRNSQNYEIVNKVLLGEVETDETQKGHYNLFKAFAVTFPDVIRELMEDGNITMDTYNSVLLDLKQFIVYLYCQYIIRKQPCSYDLTNSDKYINQNYRLNEIKLLAKKKAFTCEIKDIIKRVIKK